MPGQLELSSVATSLWPGSSAPKAVLDANVNDLSRAPLLVSDRTESASSPHRVRTVSALCTEKGGTGP